MSAAEIVRELAGEGDQADVERVLAGDSSAFEGIVRRWQGPLTNLAYRFCRDRARAEEMAQEAFLRAFRGLPKWRRDAAFSTWLFAIATNVYRSELRRIPVYAPLESVPEPLDPRSAQLSEEEDRAAQDRLLRRAVASLPDKYREAIVLYYFQSRDLAAAARSLDLPEGTLKARLFRARELLRQKLTSRRASQKEQP